VPGKEGPVTITSGPKRVVAVGYLRDTDSALDGAAAVALAFPSVLSIPYGLRVTVPKLVAAASKA